jgi:2-C-methyl-D-erythritol 2,4-cyclodiphosphate synthase
MRIGMGTDIHRLVDGRPLILGGISIDYEQGLDGHSDADVLLHAVTDALLGALGAGDIGEWFPNTNEKWKNASSDQFLKAAVEEAHRRNWVIANMDCTISAERPKLSPYKDKIKDRLAALLEIPVELVNVKAKTGEAVGPIGRGEAISSDAVVLLTRK